jgi:hypothetical protein
MQVTLPVLPACLGCTCNRNHSASTLAQMVILKMHPQINASLATMALQDLILAAQRALEETIMIARAAIRMPSFPQTQVVNV